MLWMLVAILVVVQTDFLVFPEHSSEELMAILPANPDPIVHEVRIGNHFR